MHGTDGVCGVAVLCLGLVQGCPGALRPPICRAGLPASTPAPVPSLCSPRWAQALPCSPRGPCLEPGSLSDRPRPCQLLSRAGSVCLSLSSVPCPASCLVSVATSLPCTSVPARRPCGAGHRAGGDGGSSTPAWGGTLFLVGSSPLVLLGLSLSRPGRTKGLWSLCAVPDRCVPTGRAGGARSSHSRCREERGSHAQSGELSRYRKSHPAHSAAVCRPLRDGCDCFGQAHLHTGLQSEGPPSPRADRARGPQAETLGLWCPAWELC